MCAFSPLRPLHAPDEIIGHGTVPGALAAPACARVSLAQGHERQAPGSGQDAESGRARRGLSRLAGGRTPSTSAAGATMPASAGACPPATHPPGANAPRGGGGLLLGLVDGRCVSLFFLFSSRNPMTKTESTAWHQDIAHVVHPYSNLDAHSTLGPTVIARGDGCYVYDEHGKRYIEGMSGLWCASLGFSEKRLVDAATRQLNTLPYYHLLSHRSPPPGIALAQALTAVAPEGLNHVLFSSSGSEANDAAVKLVWYYNNLLGRPQKKKIISRLHGYHGVTVA